VSVSLSILSFSVTATNFADSITCVVFTNCFNSVGAVCVWALILHAMLFKGESIHKVKKFEHVVVSCRMFVGVKI